METGVPQFIENVIDLESLEVIRTEAISPNITKKVLIEGKGNYYPPKDHTKILFKCEQRDEKGKLLNYSNRKIVNSLIIGDCNNYIEYESVLRTMRINEKSLATVKVIDHTINLIITVERIVYQIEVNSDNFNELKIKVQELKDVCKNYIDIAEGDINLYRCADTLYNHALGTLKTLPKKVKSEMTPGDHEELKSTLFTLYLNRAFTSLKIKGYVNAKESAKMAMAIQPNNVKAIFRFAVSCYYLNQHQDAYDYFNKVKGIEPYNEALKEYSAFIKEFCEKSFKKKTCKPSYTNFWEKYSKEEENEINDKKLQEKIERKEKRMFEDEINVYDDK